MLAFGPQAVRGLDLVVANDFFRTAHRVIFTSMARVVEDGGAVDFVTVRQDLTDHAEIDTVGGPAYLAALSDGQMRSTNLAYYCDIIKEKRRCRELLAVTTRLGALLLEGATSSEDLMALADREFGRLSGGAQSDAELLDQAAAMAAFLDALDHRILHKHELLGLTTGWPSLDDLTCGLIPGELTILAANTGGGKTACAVNIAATTASARHPVILFSLEMARQQLLYRVAALRSDVELWKIRKGMLMPSEIERVALAMTDTAAWPLVIDDHAASTIRDIRTRCRRVASEVPWSLIVVDYIQLVATPGRADNRALEVGEIGRGLKLLSRELNVPILALSQLSRAAAKEKRRPSLHDLRESGALEQHADNVWFLHEGKEDDATELIVGKARQGPTGSVAMRWDKSTCHFFDVVAEKRMSAEPAQAHLSSGPPTVEGYQKF